jgi:hypothetical protein
MIWLGVLKMIKSKEAGSIAVFSESETTVQLKTWNQYKFQEWKQVTYERKFK